MVDAADVLLSIDASFISLLPFVEINISADFRKLNVLPDGAVIVNVISSRVTSFTRLGAVLLLLNSWLLLVVTSGVPISNGRLSGDELSTLKLALWFTLKLMPFFLQARSTTEQNKIRMNCFMGTGFYLNVIKNTFIAELFN